MHTSDTVHVMIFYISVIQMGLTQNPQKMRHGIFWL